MKNDKYKLLRKGIIYDLIGMATMFIPIAGAFLDMLWAPYAAKKMIDMYPGNAGKIASWIVFIEEILPITDVIPTFTLMWLYTFVFSSEKKTETQIIEAEVIK